MQFRDLQRQYEALHSEMALAMSEVASSGSFIMGRHVEELEQQLAQYVGVKHCITCGNGTDALYLALRVWGVGEGDAVFVPDFTFFATAEVVALLGATPIFVDVEFDTFNLSVSDLETKIAQCTTLCPKAIIAVDLFGQPANYPSIQAIAVQHQLLLLEDGAQGFGGTIGQQRACSFGDIATTSFFPAKPLGCYGDGGALFTNNDEWASMAASLRLHGKGTDKYCNQHIGIKSRLDALQAAVLHVKLKAFEQQELQAVQQVAQQYNTLLTGIVATPSLLPQFSSSWAQYTIRLASIHQRDELRKGLSEQGIPSQIYYPHPLHQLPALAAFAPVADCCPQAQQLSQTVLSLPIHPYLYASEVEQIVNVIKQTLHG